MAIAIIPGSFDPITNGHVELVRRAAELFEHVILLVMVNNQKTPRFSSETRLRLAQEAICNIKNAKADFYAGMTYDYISQHKINAIIKGVRNEHDFQWECQIAEFNKKHAPQAETLFLYSEPQMRSISSGGIKKMFDAGEDISELVPKCVLDEMKSNTI